MLSEGDIQWSFAGNGSSVEAGLKPFGTSQENGVLRVYPANVLTGNGSMFLCSDGNTTLNVTFDLRKLFQQVSGVMIDNYLYGGGCPQTVTKHGVSLRHFQLTNSYLVCGFEKLHLGLNNIAFILN